MFSELSSSQTSNSKTKNDERVETELKPSSSDASINDGRMFGSLEELMTYIGEFWWELRQN